MQNAVVLGCGRSGTSMVAGLFAGAGYSMGRGVFAPNRGNPKGLFESREVNRINESILAPWPPISATRSRRSSWIGAWRPDYLRWLSAIPVEVEIGETRVSSGIERRIRRVVKRQPYCLKDPRFAYTLELWRPHLDDALLVCVFREPERTAASIVREVRERPYLRGLVFDYAAALDVWLAMYRWILEKHAHSGRWLFVHAEQIVNGTAIARLETETGAPLDHGFAEPELQSRSGPAGPSIELDDRVRGIYRELCKRADWDPDWRRT